MPLVYAIIGGGIGSGLRFLMTDWTHKHVAGVFPWGTLWVNLIGSFVIGILWELTERISIAPDLRVFVLVGILGGFTTFSSFALETVSLLREGEADLAIGHFPETIAALEDSLHEPSGSARVEDQHLQR